MRGKFLFTFGIILIASGAALLFVAYSSNNPGWAAFAWAAIIGGALALLGGIARKVTAFMEQKPNNQSEYGHAEIRTLIKSMAEMAAADGKIDPREVTTIADVHKRMLGITITQSEINEILSDFDPSDDILKILSADGKMVNPAMKRIIIQCCYLVMMADQHKARAEVARMYEIGEVLGISKNEVNHLISMAAN